MVTSSAPGKVYLFGEHAVVYGEPAVPCAIEKRARVTAREIDEGLRVHVDDLTLDGYTVEYSDGDGHPDLEVDESLVRAGVGYINEAVSQAREVADRPDAGFEIVVESDIPLGAGLGSSAAVVVAAIDAATRELGVELTPEEIADRAYRVEYEVQDGQASRADTFCSAMGGAVRVEGDDCRRIEGVGTLPFVIGYDGGAGDTGELVAGVRQLREEYEFAADTVGAIGDIVREGESVLGTDDYEALGKLLNFNHGLLAALGVSSRSLDAMVWAAREGGAAGAKLTGAGGGGCIVALDETDGALTALRYTPGCEDAFRAELDTDGVRRE
ncbi:mevalonate kinase [Haloarcula halophila]|uniref:mevalonate kinase n=1 Tax=Haloarcula TaxID=2237 RepID=UPI0023E3E619|nr:mevalonate kinase [Halomicroarcula sp. DFY41]